MKFYRNFAQMIVSLPDEFIFPIKLFLQPTSYTTMMVPQPAVYVPQPHYAYQAPGVGAPNPAALAAQWQTNPQLAVTSAIAPAGVSANNAIVSSTGQASHPVQQQPPSTPTGTGMIASTSANAVGAGAAGAAPITISAGPGGQWTGNRWAPQVSCLYPTVSAATESSQTFINSGTIMRYPTQVPFSSSTLKELPSAKRRRCDNSVIGATAVAAGMQSRSGNHLGGYSSAL